MIGKGFDKLECMTTKWFILILIQIFAFEGMAKISLHETTPIRLPMIHFRGLASLTKKEMNKVLLKGVQPEDSAERVMGTIGDNAVQDWLSSDEIQGSSLVQSTKTLEKSMKQEVQFGGSGPNSIGHKVTFQYLAFQSLARFNYVGYLNAIVDYDTSRQKTNLELNEKFLGNKDLFLNSTSSEKENSSSLGIRWKW